MLSDLELPLVEDIHAYNRTLVALEEMDVNILVPGHGTPALVKDNIAARFAQDRSYLKSLQQCVIKALSQGCDCDQTVDLCLPIHFAQPDNYPHAQRWNIESAYRTLGGTVSALSGWAEEWQ